ncbi:MAG: T9SS type A sorting domain-containing protein, partial [Ignavibacteriae bacterium]|nr:T9SS type A sorting domain-containing protein [Ignavibacteriota bacterium]
LPTGNLKILATRLGFSRDSVNVNVTSTSNIDSINFYLYRLYVGIKQINSTIPSEYRLFQNYPNPFNPSTNIRYQITNNGFVSLKVFDALGREIETLVNEKQPEGTYEAIFDGRNLPSGIYFYRLQTDNFTETKRMVFLK